MDARHAKVDTSQHRLEATMKFLITIDDSGQAAQETIVQMEAQQRWLKKAREQKVIEVELEDLGGQPAQLGEPTSTRIQPDPTLQQFL